MPDETLEQTFSEIPLEVVDGDVHSGGRRQHRRNRGGGEEACEIRTVIHGRNSGYGANQKTCYTIALACGADIVVMLHPDYQYSPRLLTAMAGMIASGHYDAVFAREFLVAVRSRAGCPAINMSLTGFSPHFKI